MFHGEHPGQSPDNRARPVSNAPTRPHAKESETQAIATNGFTAKCYGVDLLLPGGREAFCDGPGQMGLESVDNTD